MNEMSLRNKLLLFVTAILLFSSAITTMFLWSALQGANEAIVNKARNALEEEVSRSLAGQTGLYGERIATFINQIYRIPEVVDGFIEQAYRQSDSAPNREQLQELLHGVIGKDKQISSIYAQFEPGGYLDQDADWLKGASHSVANKGTLEIYFIRNADGSVSQQPVEQAASEGKYDETLNEFGIRNGEWYLCAKEKLTPCLMEPYIYEVSPGHQELMTSLTIPVLRDGKFVGLTGVDLNLPLFQQQTEELAKALYDGTASVLLLSSKKLIVGSSQHKDKVGRPLSELSGPEATGWSHILENNSNILIESEHILARYPIQIPMANQTWTLLLSVPKDKAMAQANVIATELNNLVKGVGLRQVIIGIIITLIAIVLLVMLLSTIAKPLRLITSHVADLTSAEGDLTQRIGVKSHSELISLAHHLNLFISKLRDIISELKCVGHEVSKESIMVGTIADDIHTSVSLQHREIDSVVTAMHEMSTTASDVARYAAEAATEAENATRQTQHSQLTLSRTKQEIEQLAVEMGTANTAISQVATSSANISGILDVIRAISEQTNLLALNAAIEAARAGDMGRGFAVVADEVRALATKTRTSTDEIGALISTLQNEVAKTLGIINSGVNRAHDTVRSSDEAYTSLLQVVTQIQAMYDHITQVATAAEEQSSVSEEINMNLTRIGDAAGNLTHQADRASQGSSSLKQQVQNLEAQLGKLRT
jgi:methyl-accepting chemotaxis protein